MRAARTVNSWTSVWGLAILSIGIFHIFPVQAQQSELTDQAGRGDATQDRHHQYHHYRLVDVGTFGGPQSFLSSSFDISTASGVLNQRGALVGWADTPMPDPYQSNCFGDCYLAHAFRLQDGVSTDLGVLVEGFNSAADGGINDKGLIAGTAENGQIDPLIPGFPELRSVLWQKDGVIQDLGTLPGGYESYSSGINRRGEVVGVASNAISDANSMSFPGYQARAFLWDRQHGMQDLGTLSGGTDAIAAMINEPGHVVGWSYTSSAPSANCGVGGFALATGSFIWDTRTGMTDLGSFGGTCTLAADLNDKDQVVGVSNLAGDQVSHAFAWDRATGLADLGTLGGSFSQAYAINEHGEVVGFSTKQGDLQSAAVLWRKSGGKWQKTGLGTINGSNCGFSFSINASAQVVGASGKDCTLPFLWEDGGPMVDLNTIISSNSSIHVFGTSTINDHGEIAASGVDSKGNIHAVLLVPCDEDHADVKGCDYDMVDEAAATRENRASIVQEPTTTLPSTPALNGPSNDVRVMLRGRLGFNGFMRNAQQVALSGVVATTSGPIATLSPTSLAFWPSAIGTANGASSVALKNIGTTSLTISRIAITGPNAGDFTQTHTCGSSLAAGASCEVDVTFRATQIGNRTGTLSITDNAHGSPQPVSLSGTGTDVVLSPAGLTFNCFPHFINCSCQTSGTAMLTNVGSTTLKISGIAVSAGPFSQSNSCGASVAAGGSCSIRVRWSPSTGGSRYDNGSVSISDSGRPSPQTLGLIGNKRCPRQ